MPSYKRPGIYVSEFLTPSATVTTGSTTTAAFVGEHFRGPTDATLITSWTQFVAQYGGFAPSTERPSELPHALYNYFSNGGRAAYVVRVLGSGTAKASVTLVDRAGTPVSTLRVDAINPGAWGNALRIDIVTRDATNGRFDVIVKTSSSDADIVERWLDVSMTLTDPRYVVSVINNSTSGSAYITATNLNSATAAPNNIPAAGTNFVLTGGNSGSAATAAERQAAVTTGTSKLDSVDAILTINMPGEVNTGVLGALVSLCENRGTAFAIIDTDAGLTPAAAVTYAANFTSSYAAVYYPRVVTPDASVPTGGATRTAPVGPLVAGKYAETDTLRGVFKAPAGLSTKLAGTLGVEKKLTNTELDTLNASNVNAIRQVPGAGVVVMGARTFKTSAADKYVNVRRTLNYIKDTLNRSTEFAIFENNDGQLWSLLNSVCSRFLSELHQLGGLKGATADEAFYVKCDEEINTPAVIASGEVRIEIGVALQQPAEFIVIRIGQWEGGNAASEA